MDIKLRMIVKKAMHDLYPLLKRNEHVFEIIHFEFRNSSVIKNYSIYLVLKLIFRWYFDSLHWLTFILIEKLKCFWNYRLQFSNTTSNHKGIRHKNNWNNLYSMYFVQKIFVMLHKYLKSTNFCVWTII